MSDYLYEENERLAEALEVIKESGLEINEVNLSYGGSSVATNAPVIPAPVVVPIEDPVDPNNVLDPRNYGNTFELLSKDNGVTPAYRTATTEEINKIGVNTVPGQMVVNKIPPKTVYRTTIWETEAELIRLLRNWTYLPAQVIYNVNNIPKWLPLDFPKPEGKEDVIWNGCFVANQYIK